MKVAVAVIFDKEQRVLITRRAKHVSHGGLWEFPGGKLEGTELPAEALVREIKEEVGIDVLDYSFLGEIIHHYATKSVTLFVFGVDSYRGCATCCESQIGFRWVEVAKLINYDFPEANHQIIELIKKGCISSGITLLRESNAGKRSWPECVSQ